MSGTAVGEMTPEAAIEKLLIARQDVARVIVISRPPGFSAEQQMRIGAAITTAVAEVVEPMADESMEIEFMIQVEVIDGGGPDGRDEDR